MSQFEQRANIKFKGRLEKSASETLSALQQVYGDIALKKCAVYDWFSRFKNRQETLEDDRRSGRPSTFRTDEMIEKVRQLIQRDRRMTIVELEQEVGISHGPINAILSDDLKMRRVSAKFVPRQLTTDQMECRMIVARKIPVITQTPYSPDLTPSGFWLFPTQKMELKGTRFATMEDVKSNATAEHRKIPKEAFCRCFQQWHDGWSKCVCVCAQGSCFEGD
jgi:transposase